MFVQVPRSTQTQAVQNRWYAARQFTTRSAPTSRGWSTSSGTPMLLAWMPSVLVSSSTSMISAGVAPCSSAAAMCWRMPGS